jgi:hypothetical protein
MRWKDTGKQGDSTFVARYNLNVEKSKNIHYHLTSSVVQWSEFVATDPEVPGSIPSATRFSE